jgi:hypothetical protein
MKKIFITLALLLLAGFAAPLFASDDGGDGAYIPDYKELVREGYSHRVVEVDYNSPRFVKAMAKPTQAYYGKGYVVYYGYTVVPIWERDASAQYAFGHPLAYYQGLMANSGKPTNLSEYAVEVRNSNYQPGSEVADRPSFRATPVTQIQSIQASAARSTTPATNAVAIKPAKGVLPPIGETIQ